MTTRKQRESFLLGFVSAAIISLVATLLASLMPIFDIGVEDSVVIQPAPTSNESSEVAAANDDGDAAEPATTVRGQGGGGPPEGRGPGSARAAEVHGEPLAAGTAGTAVLDAFAAGGCVACHSIKGVGGGTATIGPPLFQTGAIAADRRPGPTPEAYIDESIRDPDAFIMPNCPTGPCPQGVMPQTYSETLTPDQLATIVGYLSVLGTAVEAEVLVQP